MKTISIKFLGIICMFLATTIAFSQEENEDDFEIEQLTGTFQGYNKEQNQYLFSVIFDEDGVEVIENYKFIIKDTNIESKYDLKSKEFEGQKFSIKYTVEVVSEPNEDGDEDFFEIYTIKDITLMK